MPSQAGAQLLAPRLLVLSTRPLLQDPLCTHLAMLCTAAGLEREPHLRRVRAAAAAARPRPRPHRHRCRRGHQRVIVLRWSRGLASDVTALRSPCGLVSGSANDCGSGSVALLQPSDGAEAATRCEACTVVVQGWGHRQLQTCRVGQWCPAGSCRSAGKLALRWRPVQGMQYAAGSCVCRVLLVKKRFAGVQ